MDNKILVDITCIHCDTKVRISKAGSQPNCRFACPSCHKMLYLMFDISSTPQRYAFLSRPATAAPQQPPHSSAAPAKKAQKPSSHTTDPSAPTPFCDSTQNQPRKSDFRKTVYRSGIDNSRAFVGDRIPGEDPTVRGAESSADYRSANSRRPSPYYLVRKKMFGIKADRFSLCEGPNVIGRPDSVQQSDVSIPGDGTISRRSLMLTIKRSTPGRECLLEVINASNPVFVNSREIRRGESRYLRPGDIITLGHTTLMLAHD